jgi:hypothetical protein
MTCPDDGTELEREYGVSGVLLRCPKCNMEYIWSFTLKKLLTRKDFFARVEEEK